MKKITILFQINHAGYGGTEKSVLSLCRNLDNKKFINSDQGSFKKYRYKIFSLFSKKYKRRFNSKFVDPFVRVPDFISTLGKNRVVIAPGEKFLQVVESLKPDIVHFTSRGDWRPFYTVAYQLKDKGVKKIVETSIFGKSAPDQYIQSIDWFIFISDWLKSQSPWHLGKAQTIYLSTGLPKTSEDLRTSLGIPADAMVLGRITRPDLNDDDFVPRLVGKLQEKNVYFVLLAATHTTIDLAEKYSNVVVLKPSTDEVQLSKFYNTIDILIHYRIEGETFGMNIAEAMMHGKPVVSHFSHVDNSQAELLDKTEDGEVGRVSKFHDLEQYLGNIRAYLDDPELLRFAGNNAKKRAMRLFSEEVISAQHEKLYDSLMLK